MKNMKKLFSLLLALVMVMGLATTAFAADTGTITVENPQDGHTYTAYKIFDVVYDGAKYAYTIKGNSEWFTTVSNYDGIALTLPAGGTAYTVEINENFSASGFSNVLKAAVDGKTGGTELTLSNGKATATGLDLGYYFVTSSSGALCNLTTTDPYVTIRDKNDMPFTKEYKEEEGKGVSNRFFNVGETINYVITGAIPDMTGYDSYTYQITDTMTKGLTYNNNVKVYLGENRTAAPTNYLTVSDPSTNDDGSTSFTVTIEVKGLVDSGNYSAGDPIYVEYSATLNENGIGVYSTNTATLTYQDGTITTPKLYVGNFAINVDKVDGNDTETKLAGATFVLKDETDRYYHWNDETGAVTWVMINNPGQLQQAIEEGTVTALTTDNNGFAQFAAGVEGPYWLVEVEAPDGYNLLSEPSKVILTTNKSDGHNEDVLNYTATVENFSGSELPETGGMGTTIFYIAGGMLVLAAVVLLVTKRRMSAEQ